MAASLISNIRLLANTRQENKLLRGKELSLLPCIENAYIVVEDGIIAEYGEMGSIPASSKRQLAIALMPPGKLCYLPGATAIPIWYLPQAGKKNLLIR